MLDQALWRPGLAIADEDVVVSEEHRFEDMALTEPSAAKGAQEVLVAKPPALPQPPAPADVFVTGAFALPRSPAPAEVLVAEAPAMPHPPVMFQVAAVAAAGAMGSSTSRWLPSELPWIWLLATLLPPAIVIVLSTFRKVKCVATLAHEGILVRPPCSSADLNKFRSAPQGLEGDWVDRIDDGSSTDEDVDAYAFEELKPSATAARCKVSSVDDAQNVQGHAELEEEPSWHTVCEP